MSSDDIEYWKPTLQTTFGKEGNCLAAVIATLYDVKIKEIPFFEDDDWMLKVSAWFKSELNMFAVVTRMDDVEHVRLFNDSLVIAAINSDHQDVERHAVIIKNDRVVFDPMVGEVDYPVTKKMDVTYMIISDIRGG